MAHDVRLHIVGLHWGTKLLKLHASSEQYNASSECFITKLSTQYIVFSITYYSQFFDN